MFRFFFMLGHLLEPRICNRKVFLCLYWLISVKRHWKSEGANIDSKSKNDLYATVALIHMKNYIA